MIKRVLAGVGAIGLLLAASGVQAQNGPCTLTNWSSSVGATNLSVGTVADGKRRYAGPCGLNVALNNAEAYLIDTTPVDETEFNVRFYFFLNSVTADVTLYQALDGTDAVITAKYCKDENGVEVHFKELSDPLTFGVNPGWNSLEIKWTSDQAATPVAILGGASGVQTKTSSPINTSTLAIDSVRLGASKSSVVNSVPTAGSIDFDDYDSRRDTAPGRLLAGDANGDGALNIFDVVATRNDILGNSVAQGQPDCNEDGVINIFDAVCMRVRILGSP